MIDCSRNGVLLPNAVKFLLRQLALMGSNVLQVSSAHDFSSTLVAHRTPAALLRGHVSNRGRDVLWLLPRTVHRGRATVNRRLRAFAVSRCFNSLSSANVN